MVDQTRWGVSDVISENRGKTFEIKKKKIEKFQERRIKAMTKLSNREGGHLETTIHFLKMFIL